MVLTTFFFAAAKRWSAHRALARWTYPVWLYVSITGVIVYIFLRHLNMT
jgi:putative membrane protein